MRVQAATNTSTWCRYMADYMQMHGWVHVDTWLFMSSRQRRPEARTETAGLWGSGDDPRQAQMNGLYIEIDAVPKPAWRMGYVCSTRCALVRVPRSSATVHRVLTFGLPTFWAERIMRQIEVGGVWKGDLPDGFLPHQLLVAILMLK